MVRAVSENQGIIQCDVCHSTCARNIRPRSNQVAVPASSREPVSAPSIQYRLEAGATTAPIARQRPSLADLDDPNLSKVARFGSGGATGDDPAMASCGLQGLLALEISEWGRATKGRSRPA